MHSARRELRCVPPVRCQAAAAIAANCPVPATSYAAMKTYDMNTLAQKIGFCQDFLDRELDEIQKSLGVKCLLEIMEKAPIFTSEIDPSDPDMWVHMTAHISYNAGWLDALAMVAPHINAAADPVAKGGATHV